MASSTPSPVEAADPEERFCGRRPGEGVAARPPHPGRPLVRRLSGVRDPLRLPLPHLRGLRYLQRDRGLRHWGCWPGGLLPRSLDVLFIVSGFVIYLPTSSRDGDFGRVSAFAIRRVARLVPAYYVALLIALLLLLVVSTSPRAARPGIHRGASAMLQTPTSAVVNDFTLGFRGRPARLDTVGRGRASTSSCRSSRSVLPPSAPGAGAGSRHRAQLEGARPAPRLGLEPGRDCSAPAKKPD